MSGDEQRPSRLRQPLQQRAELGAPRRVERRRRLVHQQHRRIDRQRSRDGHALRFAARQLARQRVGARFDAKLFQQIAAGAFRCLGRALDTHGAVRDRRSAAPTCARRGSETGTRARRCAAAGAASRDSESAPPSRRASSTAIVPRSNGSRPAMARRIVVLPDPDGPRRAMRSPGRASRLRPATSVRPARDSVTSRKASSDSTRDSWPPDVDGVIPPPFEPARQRGERQRHREIQHRADRAGNHPAAEVGREDLRLLRQLDDREHRDERRVLEQRDEVVGHRRQRQAERLRPAHQPQHLPFAEAERARGLELSAGTASSAPR